MLVSLASGTATLTNPTVTKTGDSDGGDNCNFYGINSAVMAMGGGNVSIVGGTVTAEAKGANGVFSYGGNGGTNGAAGDGTIVYIEGTTINTTGDNGGGIMTTGGGNVTVSGGSYTSSGLGSPAIYSTADIIVENATLTSNLSEGVCIEGKNSVALTNCTLTASNTQTNGNATFKDTIMIYQSMSGDADSGTSTFSMTGGVLNSQSGHVFHVTNTTAVINLNAVTINNTDSDDVLLSVCDDGWSGADNIATLNISGENSQVISGKILVADDSTLTLNITDGAEFSGLVSGEITNASGSSISTEVGTVNVTLDETIKWYLTGNTYVTSLTGGTKSNIDLGEYTLYVNGVA